MTLSIEELDYQSTPFGEISLRRRAEPRLDGEILYEVKLGDEFLMSSLFVEAEIQLANLGLAALSAKDWDVVVGGLGLGFTALAVLKHRSVKSLQVIDVMAPVIEWHQKGLVPLGEALMADQRCDIKKGDFFELATNPQPGFEFSEGVKRVHAVLLDIDHSPSHWLNPQNEGFYSEKGLRSVADKLHPGGVFALWSNDPPETAFMELLGRVFASAESHVVRFPNPYSGGESSNTVYVAKAGL